MQYIACRKIAYHPHRILHFIRLSSVRSSFFFFQVNVCSAVFVQFSVVSSVFTLYKARAWQLKVTERGGKWGVITASAWTAATNKNTHMDTNITQRKATQNALRYKQTHSWEHAGTHTHTTAAATKRHLQIGFLAWTLLPFIIISPCHWGLCTLPVPC